MEKEVVICNKEGLSCRLRNLFQSGDMHDVILQVGKHAFNVHKIILCASSDVFKTMLTSVRWSEAQKQSVLLVEDRFCEQVFDRFLHYIYTGQLFVSHSSVGPLLTLADKYNVRELIPLCRSYMLQNLDAPVDNLSVLQWWQIAILHRDSELQKKTLSYIELNFSKVIQTTEFLSASVNTVDLLLSSSKVVVHNELMLFYGIKHWLQTNLEITYQNISMKELKSIFMKLTCHVRWSMMTKDELEWLQQDSEAQQFLSTYSPFIYLPNYAMEADNFQSTECVSSGVKTSTSPNCSRYSDLEEDHCKQEFEGSGLEKDHCKKKFGKSVTLKCSKKCRCHHYDLMSNIKATYSSRIYLNDHWSSALTVSNFTAFPRYGTRTFIFSTPRTGYRKDARTLDWEVELHPKGVHFPPAILIGLERDGNKMVDEAFINTVRVSIMSRSPQELPVKVEVNILVRATCESNPDHYYIERCRRRVCIFDSSYQRHNLDDIVPLENVGTYLQPDIHIPELYLSPTVAFTLCIVIRPLS